MPISAVTIARAQPRHRDAVGVARAVRELEPYQAVSSRESIDGRPDQLPHKLDWNEATVPPSPLVTEAIVGFLGASHHLNWYPVLNSTNLIERLAVFHEMPEACFLVTNGSDEALDTVCKTYLDHGDSVLVPSPTYTHFLVFAQAAGGHVAHHYSDDPFVADIGGIGRAIQRMRPRLVYLVSPNNPTGVIYGPDEVATLLGRAPETLFVVDEAYSEFSGVTCRQLVETYPNLVVTRTFSKAYGLAALRIGYAMASPAVISDLRRVANPKSVNAIGQIAAIAALGDQAHLSWFCDSVAMSKAMMAEWFAARGLECRLTPANYVMARFDRAPWVVRSLAEEGVYVRDRSSMPQLNGFVRFSVGTPAQTEDVLERLGRVLDRLHDTPA